MRRVSSNEDQGPRDETGPGEMSSSGELTGSSRVVPLVLVSDASAEGGPLILGLRKRGFRVLDVPPSLVATAVRTELPNAIVLDVDVRGALETLERLRGEGVEVLALTSKSALELPELAAEGRLFVRPVEPEAIAARLAEVAPAEPRPLRGTTPPPSYLPRARETARPDGLASDLPPSLDPLELVSLVEAGVDEGAPFEADHVEPSPMLVAMLETAAERVASMLHSVAPASDEPALDLLVGPEHLALLDEPLDGDDDELGTGHGSVQGTPIEGRASAGRASEPEQLPLDADVSFAGSFGAGTGVGAPVTSVGEPEASRPFDARLPAPPPTPAIREMAALPPELRAALERAREPEVRATAPPSTAVDSTERAPPTAPMSAAAPSPSSERARLGHLAPPPSEDRFAPATQELGRQPERAPAPEREPPRELGREPPRELGREPPRELSRDSDRDARPEPAGRADLPGVLAEGDLVRVLGKLVAERRSASLVVSCEHATRRVLLHEGDLQLVASEAASEALVPFLVARGDLPRELGAMLERRVPGSGRHAAAALIAHGYLGQDDLWKVLRAHAEWLLGRALLEGHASLEVEAEPPARLRSEPSVFGGATGAEVLIEAARRVLPPAGALRLLGGTEARVAPGPHAGLLGECALAPHEAELVAHAGGARVTELMTGAEPDLASALLVLAALGVVSVLEPARQLHEEPAPSVDPLDEEAIRKRVAARLALVHDGDYFSILGVARAATGYEIRQRYLDLRRSFEPARLLTAGTVDLLDDVRLVLEVLDEAYDILRDAHRRERYRRALDAGPPG